jgi:AcrR family transcriptional regulator
MASVQRTNGMGRRKDPKDAADLGDEVIPELQRQSMERSLQSARVRAQERIDRFLAAAKELMGEAGSLDFTVQDVVARSKMSFTSFYKFFSGKDDLLVAAHEMVVAREVVPRLRKRIDKQTDPLLRFKAFIEGLLELTARPGHVARALTNHQNRLAETRPADLARALKPQFDLLVELIDDISRRSPLPGDLTTEGAARMVHYVVLSAVHARVFGSEGAFEHTAATIWQFCTTGIGVGVTAPARRRTGSGRG